MPEQLEFDVAVLGCGNMGSAIARTLLAGGYRTVVWNRTPTRTLPLQEAGAALATSARDAIAAAPLTIICVGCTRDVEELLRRAESALEGATVLNLTSGTPDDAVRLAVWADAHDLEYLDGAILAYPEQIGSADARIVTAGDETLWRRHRKVVLDLAGASTYAGEGPGAANVVDTGITGVFYFSSVVAFIEAVRYFLAAGVAAEAVADLIGHATAQLDEQLRDTLQRTVSGDFGTAQATVAVYHEAGEAFLAAVRTKAPAPLLTTTVELLTQAMSAGLGDSDISALATMSDTPASG